MMKVIKFYEPGQENPEQLIVQWNLGNTCNYSCEYCPSYLHNGTVSWPDIESVKQVLTKIRSKFNKNIKVEFVGGEVTLWKDYIDLVKFCKSNTIRSFMISNSSRTVRYWNDIAPYLDEVLLTFHPDTVDRDHFDSVLNVLLEHNVYCIVHIAMKQSEFWPLAEYYNILRDRYPQVNIDMIPLMDKENKFNNNGYYYNYDDSQLSHLAKNEFSTMNYTVEYQDGTSQLLSLHEIRNSGLNDFRGFVCGTNVSLICIDFRGLAAITVCNQRKRINIYNDDIDEIFRPVVCQASRCDNSSDLRILKIGQNNT
jgi:organic radical activating enzyme